MKRYVKCFTYDSSNIEHSWQICRCRWTIPFTTNTLTKRNTELKKKKTSIGYEFMQSAKRYLILQTKFHLHQYS